MRPSPPTKQNLNNKKQREETRKQQKQQRTNERTNERTFHPSIHDCLLALLLIPSFSFPLAFVAVPCRNGSLASHSSLTNMASHHHHHHHDDIPIYLQNCSDRDTELGPTSQLLQAWIGANHTLAHVKQAVRTAFALPTQQTSLVLARVSATTASRRRYSCRHGTGSRSDVQSRLGCAVFATQ